MSRVAVIHAVSEPSPEWQLQAALWYLFSYASKVTVFPFLNQFFFQHGLNEAQLGLINCLRPWIALPAPILLSAAADRLGLHRIIMLGGLALGVTLRCLLLLNQSFAYVLVVVVVAQICSSGVCVLADAAVVSACSMEGQYGKLRKWGAVGWGAMSAVAGAVMGLWGMTAAFGLHILLALPCLRFGYALHTPQPILPPPPASARRNHAVHHRPKLETVLEEKEEDVEEEEREEEEEEEEEKEEEQDNDWDTEAGQDQAVPLLRAAELSRLPRSPPRSSAPTQAAAGQLPDTAAPTLVQLSTLTLQTKGQRTPLPSNGVGHAVDQPLDLHPQGPGSHSQLTRSHFSPASSPSQHQCVNTEGGKEDAGGRGKSSSSSSSGQGWGAASIPSSSGPPKEAQASGAGSRQQQGGEGCHRAGAGKGGVHGMDVLLAFCKDPQICLFLAMAAVFGFGFGTIESFLFVFLQQLGGSQLLMGLTLTVTCIAEVPVFEVQGWLMRRLGPVPLLDVVALCYVVRMAAYATLPHWSSPWAVLGVEALHGVTFGLGWGVGTNVAKLIAPPGYAATLQGAFQGSYFGLGYGIGALSGGFISHRFGFPVMFSTAALVVCVMWCCLSLIRQRMSDLAEAAARHAGSLPSSSLPSGDQMLLGGPGLLAWILDLLRTAVVKGRPSRLTYTALQSAV